MNICFSFFFKRKEIGYNTCSFYFFFIDKIFLFRSIEIFSRVRGMEGRIY